MRRVWRKAQKKIVKTFRANNMIKALEVFLIDENSEQIGKIDTRKALDMARAADLDLVEVNPTAKPPVVKIMDFWAFVEFMPKTEWLVHISQLANQRVEKTEDVVKAWDLVKVKLLEKDSMWRYKLSIKEAN